jgi:hypothetical protein
MSRGVEGLIRARLGRDGKRINFNYRNNPAARRAP